MNSENGPTTTRVHAMGTPVMAYDLWGVSPLYENDDRKVDRIPTVTPIDQVPGEGNCGEVTNRGEEACECAVKLTSTCARSVRTALAQTTLV